MSKNSERAGKKIYSTIIYSEFHKCIRRYLRKRIIDLRSKNCDLKIEIYVKPTFLKVYRYSKINEKMCALTLFRKYFPCFSHCNNCKFIQSYSKGKITLKMNENQIDYSVHKKK